MHTIQKRPCVVGDEIAARPMMYLALSYDHRVIDGKEAVGFLDGCVRLERTPLLTEDCERRGATASAHEAPKLSREQRDKLRYGAAHGAGGAAPVTMNQNTFPEEHGLQHGD